MRCSAGRAGSPGAGPGLPDLLELSLVEPGVAEAVLLLLTEDLQLQEELLLLEQPGVVGVHGRLALLPLLIWRDVLVVLQLLYPGLRVLALFATVLVIWILGMALLFSRKRQ